VFLLCVINNLFLGVIWRFISKYIVVNVHTPVMFAVSHSVIREFINPFIGKRGIQSSVISIIVSRCISRIMWRGVNAYFCSYYRLAVKLLLQPWMHHKHEFITLALALLLETFRMQPSTPERFWCFLNNPELFWKVKNFLEHLQFYNDPIVHLTAAR
jgi:hypothetical protein